VTGFCEVDEKMVDKKLVRKIIIYKTHFEYLFLLKKKDICRNKTFYWKIWRNRSFSLSLSLYFLK